MARVLITGGAGFIGRHCARRFLEHGWEVRLLDQVLISNENPLVKLGCSVHTGDIRDGQAVHSAMENCQAVIHLAALVSVPESIEHPEKTRDVNVGGTRNVLYSAQKLGLTHAVFASSAAVYGEQGKLPIDETTMLEALSPYGASKISNEKDIDHARNGGLNAIALRFFNVYGKGQSSSSGYASLIPMFIETMVQGKQPTIFGDGSQTRDFIHVEDLTHAIFELVTMSAPYEVAVANVATQTQTSVLDVFKTINQHLVHAYDYAHMNPEYSHPRQGDIKHSSGSNSKLKSIIPWEPQIKFEKGLHALIDDIKRGR